MTKLTSKIKSMTEIKHTADKKVIMTRAEVISELCKGIKELGPDTSRAIAMGFVGGRFESMDHKDAWKWAEKDLGIEEKVIKGALKTLRAHEHAKHFEGKLYGEESSVVIQIEKKPEHADAFDKPKA